MHSLPHAIQAQLSEYGSEDYSYSPNQSERLKSTFTRTIRPTDDETNSQFETRMDRMARALVNQHGCLHVNLKLCRADGAIVECIVTVIYDAPKEAPIMLDQRRAGGRVPGRGCRGSGKAAA